MVIIHKKIQKEYNDTKCENHLYFKLTKAIIYLSFKNVLKIAQTHTEKKNFVVRKYKKRQTKKRNLYLNGTDIKPCINFGININRINDNMDLKIRTTKFKNRSNNSKNSGE